MKSYLKKLAGAVGVTIIALGMFGCADGNNTDDPKTGKSSSFIKIEGGEITGSSENQCWSSNYAGVFVENRTVKLNSFYICDHEVTNAEFKAIMSDTELNIEGVSAEPSYSINKPKVYVTADGEDKSKQPVENVTWYDAVYYCNLLSQKEGYDCVYTITNTTVFDVTHDSAGESGTETKKYYIMYSATVTADYSKNGYRLPTEAEWEYAARGGNPSAEAWKYEYSGADSEKTEAPEEDSAAESVGWYSKNSCSLGVRNKGYGTHQVGLKEKNTLKLFDMSGNVQEWCYDLYNSTVTSNDSAYKEDDKVVNPLGAATGSGRVLRGGHWGNNAEFTSVGRRDYEPGDTHNDKIGFRVCRNAQ